MTDALSLSRRQVLRSASLAALASFFPFPLSAFDRVARATTPGRVLVLVELNGGNDGLNTIVPYQDPTYIARRGALALRPDGVDYTTQVIPFSDFSGVSSLPAPAGAGVHRSLEDLQPAWQAGDMAIVHGIGYPNPNRSHFRGIDIWTTGATDDHPVLRNGWLGRMVATDGVPVDVHIPAVVFSRVASNPARHLDVTTLSMGSPKEFLDRSRTLVDPSQGEIDAAPTALRHVLTTHRQAVASRVDLNAAVTAAPTFSTVFPTHTLGKQARYVAQCIAGGLSTPFYKLALGGFDTHTVQLTKHADLLAQLAQSLAALRSALIEAGRWDDVLVMTYSEFGRRIQANGSSGTDHGTAAPHLALGGRVAGGMLGTQPSLTDVDSRGDMRHQVDYRQWWATGAAWIGLEPATRTAGLDSFADGIDLTPLAIT